MANTVSKQPWESWLYDFNFAPRLQAGELISSIDSITQEEVTDLTAAPPTLGATTDLTISEEAASLQIVQCRIAGGEAGKLYKLTARALTELGNSAECEGYLLVEDT